MDTLIDAAAQQRIANYLNQIGEILDHPARKASFATYALGLFGDASRKTMEGIAAQACADPARMDATRQSIHHFITNSNWRDQDVRLAAAHYAHEPASSSKWLFMPLNWSWASSNTVMLDQAPTVEIASLAAPRFRLTR